MTILSYEAYTSPMKLKNILFGGHGAATRFGDIGLTFARVCLGLGIAIGHGYSKIFHDGGFGPSEQFINGTAQLGFPAPMLFAWMAALSEFLGGLLLAAGLLTRPAAFSLAGTMLGAAFLAHRNDPFWAAGGANKEFALLYCVPFMMFIFTGGGRFAVDALLRKK